MPWAAAAAVAGAYITSQGQQSAASTQAAAAQQGQATQQWMFNKIQGNLTPYMTAGTKALGQQQALMGLSGAPAQKAAIAQLSSSPQMQAMLQQGENAMLQNASATGGLRGGNLQAAMAQFRPQLLSQLINQQMQNIGNLTALGQNAAAGVGNAGMQAAGNISNLLQQQGAATAGGQMAQANAIGGGLSQLGGMYASGAFGGGSNYSSPYGGTNAASSSYQSGPMSGFMSQPIM